eukprot:Polyplicarium_translucidae@DN2096_c0_g1_i5.p1
MTGGVHRAEQHHVSGSGSHPEQHYAMTGGVHRAEQQSGTHYDHNVSDSRTQAAEHEVQHTDQYLPVSGASEAQYVRGDQYGPASGHDVEHYVTSGGEHYVSGAVQRPEGSTVHRTAYRDVYHPAEIKLHGGERIVRPGEHGSLIDTRVTQTEVKQQYASLPLLGSANQLDLHAPDYSGGQPVPTTTHNEYQQAGGGALRRVTADAARIDTVTAKRSATAPLPPGGLTGPPRYAFELSREITKAELTEEHYVLRENVVHHEMLVPRRRLTETAVSRTVVTPEKVLVEEIVEDVILVKERIIDVKKPVIMEKV